MAGMINAMAMRQAVMANTPHTATASGSMASFSTDMVGKLRHLVVGIEPVQAGSGDPSPENIRPITGWTGANVQADGKNLAKLIADASSSNASWKNLKDNSVTVYSNQTNPAYRYIRVYIADVSKFSGETLTFSAKAKQVSGATINPRIVGAYYKDGTRIGSNLFEKTGTYITYTMTVPDSVENGTKLATALYCDGNNGGPSETEFTEIQLERGSTVTTFEPYQGKTISISWESEAGTVYGGTLDVVTGVLTVDRETIDLGTLAWIKSSNDGQFYSETNFHAKPQGDVLCSMFMTGVFNAAYYKTRDNSLELRIGTQHRTWVYSTIYAGMSNTAFKTAMSGVQLVYELAEPQTYQLTPTMVKSLIGTNNVWADTGDVESLTYWTH